MLSLSLCLLRGIKFIECTHVCKCMHNNRRWVALFPSHVLGYFSIYSENCSMLSAKFPFNVMSGFLVINCSICHLLANSNGSVLNMGFAHTFVSLIGLWITPYIIPPTFVYCSFIHKGEIDVHCWTFVTIVINI